MKYSPCTSLFLLLLLLINSATSFGDSLKSLACGMDGLMLILRNPQLQGDLEIATRRGSAGAYAEGDGNWAEGNFNFQDRRRASDF